MCGWDLEEPEKGDIHDDVYILWGMLYCILFFLLYFVSDAQWDLSDAEAQQSDLVQFFEPAQCVLKRTTVVEDTDCKPCISEDETGCLQRLERCYYVRWEVRGAG